MDGSDVIAALGGKMSRLATKVDAIFASLQRRTTETWNDANEFALWALSNCYINDGEAVKLGIKTVGGYVKSSSGSLTSGTGRPGQGIKVTLSEAVTITHIKGTAAYSNSQIRILRFSDLVEVYQGDGSEVYPNIALSADTYIVDISSKTGDQETSATFNDDVDTPYTIGGVTVELSYYDRSSDFTTLSPLSARTYAILQFETVKIENTGILTGTAESPLVSPTDLVEYDMVDYIIEANGGSYQVDILDSANAVLLTDVEKLDPLAGLPTDKLIKARVTLNRPLDNDVSPEIKSLTLAYLE